MGLMDILQGMSGAQNAGSIDLDAVGRLGLLNDRANMNAVMGGHSVGSDVMAGLGNMLTSGLGANAQGNVAAMRANQQYADLQKAQKAETDRKQNNFMLMFKTLIGEPGGPTYVNGNTGFTEGGGMSPFMQSMMRMTGMGPPQTMGYGYSQSQSGQGQMPGMPGPIPMMPIYPPRPINPAV